MDDNNVIENLGIDNVTKIQKEAAIARANSERDIKIAQSQANSQSNDAEVTAQTQISITQNELAIKRATLKAQADTEQALSQMMIEKLTGIVRGAAEPLSKTEKIIMFGEGNAEKMVGDTLKTAFGVVEGLKEGTGIDLAAILNGFAGTKLAFDAADHDSKTDSAVHSDPKNAGTE